jgi:peptidoglycan lytic transglycosylase
MKKFYFLLVFLISVFFISPLLAADSSLKMGYEAFLNKDYPSAVAVLKGSPVSKNHPLLDYYLWALGKSQVETKDFEGGQKNLEDLVRLEPQSLFLDRAKANIGRALQEKGQADKAKDYLKTNLAGLSEDAKGEALYYLGLAEIQSGEKESGLSHLKEVYVRYPASPSAEDVEAKLSAEAGALSLSPQEQGERADQLREAKKFSEASKAYDLVLSQEGAEPKSATRVKKGECLYALKRFTEAVPYLESASAVGVQPDLARPALLHLGIAQQKAGGESQATVVFERVHRNFPGSVEGEEALYRIGMIAADGGRKAEAATAFQRLADEYPKGNFRDKGLWQAAWSAYRDSDWSGALKFLSALEKGAVDFPTQGKAVYWQARVREKQGDKTKAREEFQRAARVSPYSYYGFFSLKRLKGSKEISETPEVPPEWKISKTDPGRATPPAEKNDSSSSEDLHFRKALFLYQADMGRQSLTELQTAIKQSEGNSSALRRLLEEARRSDAYYMPVLMGQKYWDTFKSIFADERAAEDYRVDLQFPFAFRPEVQRAAKEFSLSPYLIVALMRQESAFQPWVVSSANAQGLMQMLPATARMRARSLGGSTGDLLDPSDNIRLGTAELKGLLDLFSGNWIQAIAGYNAGPGRPRQWAAQNGSLEDDEFIEEIPFAETNLYVKLVLRNYWAYKTLYKS